MNNDWEFISDSESDTDDNTEETIKSDKENVSDQWTEEINIDDQVTGNTDTMLHSVDFREFIQILSVAPGENNVLLSIFQDKYAEFLAFSAIYCGQARPDNSLRRIPLHYSTICKWELRNVDIRCAKCIPNLFYKLKKLQIKQIQDKVTLAIRECRLNGKNTQ